MKVTMKDIKDAEMALASILTKEMDFKVAYRMRKISTQLISTMRNIENKRQALVSKYGVEGADKKVAVPQDKQEAFIQEFDAVLETETDIDIQQIPLECLEGLKISPVDVGMLEKFLEPEKK